MRLSYNGQTNIRILEYQRGRWNVMSEINIVFKRSFQLLETNIVWIEMFSVIYGDDNVIWVYRMTTGKLPILGLPLRLYHLKCHIV